MKQLTQYRFKYEEIIKYLKENNMSKKVTYFLIIPCGLLSNIKVNVQREKIIKENSIDDGYDLYVSWTDIDNAPTILESEE